MRAVAERSISEEEYLALEEAATEKHEYYNGRIFAMSGGSNTHALLCANAGATLRVALRGSQCRAVGSNQRVKIEKTGLHTYPDAAAYCLPARFQGRNDQMLLSPKLLSKCSRHQRRNTIAPINSITTSKSPNSPTIF